MQVLDCFRFLNLGRPRIQQPGFGVMGIAYLKEGRFLREINLQRPGIPGCKSVSVDLVVQGRRRTRDVVQVLAFDAQLRQG